jgi:hypothetical protein
MKTIKVQLLVISLALISCSKTHNIPDPSVELIIGTTTKGNVASFVPFRSHDTILYSELDTINLMIIKISEIHIDTSFFFGSERKPIFAVDISTSKDKQNYISGSNCFLGGYGGSSNVNNTDCDLFGQIEFPVKISKNPVPNNDTLEFNDGNDYIEFHIDQNIRN